MEAVEDRIARRGERGASLVEYALLIALLSLGLVLGLRGLDGGMCELPGRVAQLMGGPAAACAGGGPRR